VVKLETYNKYQSYLRQRENVRLTYKMYVDHIIDFYLQNNLHIFAEIRKNVNLKPWSTERNCAPQTGRNKTAQINFYVTVMVLNIYLFLITL